MYPSVKEVKLRWWKWKEKFNPLFILEFAWGLQSKRTDLGKQTKTYLEKVQSCRNQSFFLYWTLTGNPELLFFCGCSYKSYKNRFGSAIFGLNNNILSFLIPEIELKGKLNGLKAFALNINLFFHPQSFLSSTLFSTPSLSFLCLTLYSLSSLYWTLYSLSSLYWTLYSLSSLYLTLYSMFNPVLYILSMFNPLLNILSVFTPKLCIISILYVKSSIIYSLYAQPFFLHPFFPFSA